MIKKIGLAVVIGILATLFFAQFDEWIHQKMVNYSNKSAMESLGCTTSYAVHSLNFFYPSLVLTDIQTNSLNSDWSWKCKRCEMHSSWFSLFMHGQMEMQVVMDGFDVTTQVKGRKLAIEEHITSLINKAKSRFSPPVKSIDIKNSQCTINDPFTDSTFTFGYHSSSRKSTDCYKTTVSIFTGGLLHQQMNYLASLGANIDIAAQKKEDTYDVSLRVAGTFQLPQFDATDVCYLSGSFVANNGRFSLHSASNKLVIDPIIITQSHARIYARFPLLFIAQCLKKFDCPTIFGTGQLSAHISFDPGEKTEVQIVAQDVICDESHLLDTVKLTIMGVDGKWRAKGGISRDRQDIHVKGSLDEKTKVADLHVHNKTALSLSPLPYWKIAPHNFSCHIGVQQDTIDGGVQCTAVNSVSNLIHAIHATAHYNNGLVTVKGAVDDRGECEGKVRIYPHCVVDYFKYSDHEKRPLIMMETVQDTMLEGFISFAFVRALVNQMWRYDIQGEGVFGVKGLLRRDDGYFDISLADAAIRLPQTYNFIDGFDAHVTYDRRNRSFTMDTMNLSMHRGRIECLHAKVLFGNDGKVVFAHAPFIFDHCLINIKKDLFAIVSGNLLFSASRTSSPSVTGNIIIDRAQLKENIFSQMVQKSLIATTHSAFSMTDVPLLCDVGIETKFPIRVDTPFLRSNAKISMRLTNDGKDPSMLGSVVLLSGDLSFPYRPLHITKGTITFSKGQLFDPSIELVARNKIKKYDIGLQVTGSLNAHHIMLDSTPPLSEEQIIALLLVGSEQDSLNSMIPALIVQNMKHLLFGAAQSSFIEKYFKPLMRPFSINLVPSFTDQTGRGGLRGALEIAIDDRWRAKIEKNFSLTEDTRFELEYLLSDDITVRGIRDERRDLGGEVEVRWKF